MRRDRTWVWGVLGVCVAGAVAWSIASSPDAKTEAAVPAVTAEQKAAPPPPAAPSLISQAQAQAPAAAPVPAPQPPAPAAPPKPVPPSPYDRLGKMNIEGNYAGPLRDTLIQRLRDPVDGSICYVFLPISVPHSPPQEDGIVRYGANPVGAISCFSAPPAQAARPPAAPPPAAAASPQPPRRP